MYLSRVPLSIFEDQVFASMKNLLRSLISKLFTEIYNNFRQMVNDQVALNHFKDMVSYKFLDKEKYYTIGNFFNNTDGTHKWDGVTDIIPPKEIKIHHANYVVGVEDKIKLIKLIRTNYENLVR